MNKKEIAESVHKKLKIKRFEAYSFIDFLTETVIESLMKGEKVMLANFGTFKVVKREKKKVIDPNNKTEMIIPSRKIVKFIPSTYLKDLVRK